MPKVILVVVQVVRSETERAVSFQHDPNIQPGLGDHQQCIYTYLNIAHCAISIITEK